jgi:phage terminase small subunit
VKADDVLRELIRLAQADPARAFDEKGNLLPIHEMPPEARAAIAGFDLEELWDGRGPKRKQVGRVRKVRFWDKPRALELLAKHLGLLTERLQVSVLTLEQLVEASRKEPP